ncbi:MAG TPA: NAD(P)H-dependent glycerol-3-phosphate dehydrogenase [Thermoanaerobaculia bacterium]|nr:NAD(P)H-dependent glycerol-3-phosphate dehydrogenase [Thermoanaerobaculia bacterium]
MKQIAVLGAGSFGTALAVHLASMGANAGGNRVRLWARNPELARQMAEERANPEYLPDVEIPAGVEPTAEMEPLAECDIVLVVVPSHGFRGVLRQFLRAHPADRPAVIVSATKGIETDTLARMSQVSFEEGTAAGREVRFATLSGPTFAAELARNSPSAAVVASEDAALATEIRERLSTRLLRLYSSSDVVGVELGGTVKNVVAIAAGTVTGLGFGQNTLAALITRGLHEITRLGIAYGGQPRTFAGLAALGDLVLTCTGGLSRNRRTGLELAAGKSLDEITGETHMVAEGIRNSLAVSRLAAQKGVEMPITQQMVAVLYEGKDPRLAVEQLMTRELKAETEL